MLENKSPAHICEEIGISGGSSLRALAIQNGLKPYQLTRRFQKRFGLTPTAWRCEWRLRRALELIIQGGSGLAEIASDCGYSDQSHLSRDMKQCTGMTPMAFRRSTQV
ncbi:helix-turn-helix domain-containing protein [Hyphococcus flavus]|uniref:helix-turn-helix domain-containing protein n=1 Tax=Hyphococcus flavus TaxID=1866326 RepID=UPI003B75BF11